MPLVAYQIRNEISGTAFDLVNRTVHTCFTGKSLTHLCCVSLVVFLIKIRSVWIGFIVVPYFIETPFLNANSVDPDRSVTAICGAYLGLNGLQMSLIGDARNKHVKTPKFCT